MVETVIFHCMSPHCDLDCVIANQSFSHDAVANDAASPHQVCLQKNQQLGVSCVHVLSNISPSALTVFVLIIFHFWMYHVCCHLCFSLHMNVIFVHSEEIFDTLSVCV